MTLPDGLDESTTGNYDGNGSSTSSWEILYCSHLWADSNLRRAIIDTHTTDRKLTRYCYTCRGKVRKYEVNSPRDGFVPNTHSTPNAKAMKNRGNENDVHVEPYLDVQGFSDTASEYQNNINDTEPNGETDPYIPSISRQIDSSYRSKFTERRPYETNRRRLRQSLNGVGCIVNFALTDSPVKKRTQIQACSISVMIVAIVVISFVLVNFTTPTFTRATNVVSTIVVPTEFIDYNESSTLMTNLDVDPIHVTEASTVVFESTTETSLLSVTSENTSLISNIISKIRKNIRMYPKDSKKALESQKRKDVFNRDLSQKFCSCQLNEVCMLDESSGKSVCRPAADVDDPTGCGGLCALETEACQLVDRLRGVRVCRLLTLVTCSSQQWRCRNGLCVAAEARCDGTIQCYDRSDEMHCECDLTKHFRCGHSISCFPNTKLCDGVIDCWDGVDEVNCTAECPEDKFTCTDGQCIPPMRFCDGFADCADGSDEPRGCGACGTHEIRCDNHRCVPRTARCDGIDNCGDSTDESHCS